jgi:hypothetical protein
MPQSCPQLLKENIERMARLRVPCFPGCLDVAIASSLANCRPLCLQDRAASIAADSESAAASIAESSARLAEALSSSERYGVDPWPSPNAFCAHHEQVIVSARPGYHACCFISTVNN